MTIQVVADKAFPAGHAVIRVSGAAGAAASPGFRVGREDWVEGKLGAEGWQSSEAVLMPDRAEVDGADLLLHVGWRVCQHLEGGMYTFQLPGAGLAAEPVSWPDIAPIYGGAVDVLSTAVAKPRAAPPPPVAAPAVVAEPPPLPPSPASPARSRPVGYALLGLALLITAGGAAWWLYQDRNPVVAALIPPVPPSPAAAAPAPPPIVPPPTPPVVPTVTEGPAGFGGLTVPEVLARAPNPAAITAEGTSRLQADRKDDGLLLLEAAADRGDGSASAALARLYDPLLFQPSGPIPKADPRQAARHYRDAARGGVDVAAAREALRRSLETKGQSGDLGATLGLRDFWP